MPAAKPPMSVQSIIHLVEVSFSLHRLMRALQATKRGFSYDDLAQHLRTEFNLSEHQAKEQTWHFVSQMSGLLEHDGALYHLVEPRPLTMEESVAGWKMMMAELTPRKIRRAIRGYVAPRRMGLAPQASHFEQFRPMRESVRWVEDAPDCVMACYDHGGKLDRYTVVLGGKLWSCDMARRNWESGIDPRVTHCVSMSANPTAPNGIVRWNQCLPAGPHLGHKIGWNDLPPQVRMQIAEKFG